MSTVRQHLGLLWLMRNRLATSNPQYDHAWAGQAAQFVGVHLDELIGLACGADVEDWVRERYPEIPADFPAARATPSPAPIQQDAPPLGWRDDLQAIDRAMQHMGDALNGVDAVEAEDEEAVSGGFEAMERLLAANDWVLVPVKPTPKMVDATFNDRVENESHNARNKRIYAAMISAAIGTVLGHQDRDYRSTHECAPNPTHPSATARNEKD